MAAPLRHAWLVIAELQLLVSAGRHVSLARQRVGTSEADGRKEIDDRIDELRGKQRTMAAAMTLLSTARTLGLAVLFARRAPTRA